MDLSKLWKLTNGGMMTLYKILISLTDEESKELPELLKQLRKGLLLWRSNNYILPSGEKWHPEEVDFR